MGIYSGFFFKKNHNPLYKRIHCTKSFQNGQNLRVKEQK
jgi:hypothetical protein